MIPNTESCVTNIMQSNMTGHAPPTPLAWEGVRLKISEKSLLGGGGEEGAENFILNGRLYCCGERGHIVLK